jgi:hypothetical protein
MTHKTVTHSLQQMTKGSGSGGGVLRQKIQRSPQKLSMGVLNSSLASLSNSVFLGPAGAAVGTGNSPNRSIG